MTDHQREIRARVCDPGTFVKREGNFTEPIAFWSARAVWAYVEPYIKPIDELLVEIVRLRDQAAEMIDSPLPGLALEATHQWQRYATAETVITQILKGEDDD